MASKMIVKKEPGSDREVGESAEKSDLETLIQLKELESRNELASDCLAKCAVCLSTEGRTFPERVQWQKEIAGIEAQKAQKSEVLIGVKGITGAGKTTAINTLIGFRILPAAGSGRAVTAVLTYIRYNYEYGEVAEFVCKIKFCSSEEIRRVIKTLQREFDKTGLMETNSPEAIKFSLIFPEIPLEQLRKEPVDKLIESAKKRWPIDGEHLVKEDDKAKFRAAIASFISTTPPMGNDDNPKGVWHIVKEVTIFVKSELLRDGLVLVDFPGAGDANTARTSSQGVNLDSVQILAPFTRAVDEKTGGDLLTEHFELYDKLSGNEAKCKRSGIIYGMTRLDEALKNIKEYLEANPKAERHLKRQPGIQEKRKVTEKIVKLRHYIDLEKKSSSSLQKKTKENLHKLKALSRQNKFPPPRLAKGKLVIPAETPEPKPKDWTKFRDAFEEAAKMLQESQKDIESSEETLKDAKTEEVELKKETKAILIKYAMQTAGTDIKEEAVRRAKKFDKGLAKKNQGRSDTANTPAPQKEPSFHVIGISSQAYHELKRGDEVSGFHNLADTGIPGLKCKLQLVLATVRQNNNTRFSRRFDNLEKEIVEWMENEAFNEPITDKEREDMTASSEELFRELLEEIRTVISSKASDVKKAVAEDLEPSLERVARVMCKLLVAEFEEQEKLHFSVYRAICIRGGKYASGDGKVFKWTKQAKQIFLSSIEEDWMAFFESTVQDCFDSMVDDIYKKLEKFGEARSEAAEEFCPALKGRVSNLQTELPKMKAGLDDEVAIVKATLQNDSAKALKTAKVRIKKFVNEACHAASDVEKGNGIGKRMREALKEHIAKKGPKFFAALIREMLEEIQDVMGGLETALHEVIDPIISEIPEKFSGTLSDASEANAKEAKDEMRVILEEFKEAQERSFLEIRNDPRINDPELQKPSESSSTKDSGEDGSDDLDFDIDDSGDEDIEMKEEPEC